METHGKVLFFALPLCAFSDALGSAPSNSQTLITAYLQTPRAIAQTKVCKRATIFSSHYLSISTVFLLLITL